MPDVIARERRKKLSEDLVVEDLRDVFHRHKIRLRLARQAAEVSDQRPLPTAVWLSGKARLSSFSAVRRKRLARRAASQQSVGAIAPKLPQCLRGDSGHVTLDEPGSIVFLVRKPATAIHVNTSCYVNTSADEAVREAAESAKQIDASDHCPPTAGRRSGTRYS